MSEPRELVISRACLRRVCSLDLAGCRVGCETVDPAAEAHLATPLFGSGAGKLTPACQLSEMWGWFAGGISLLLKLTDVPVTNVILLFSALL